MSNPKASAFQQTAVTLRGLLSILCIGFIVMDMFIIFSRMFYPYQLEWMEGASLIQVKRLMAGQALYTPPSINYVPLIYPPLFFYASAGIAKLIGFGFGALRFVSFLSSAICAFIIYAIIAETTNSKFAGLLGAGCFVSTFLLAGQWFDIARTDMFAAVLSMLAIYLAREKDDHKNVKILLSGLLFALAFLTRQGALLVGLAAILYYSIFNWRRASWLALSFGLSFTILYTIFWFNSTGWISFYLFTIPSAHVFNFKPGHIISVLVSQFSSIPLFVIAAIIPMIMTPRKIFSDKAYRYYYAMAGSLIVTGVIGRLNAFSGPNVYVPSYLGVALLVGLEAGWLMETVQPANNKSLFVILEWGLLSIQFASLIPAYIQTKIIPTVQDRSAGNALVAKIKSYKGDVLLFENNYLALYAGKTPYYNEMPMSEISGEGNMYSMPQWSLLQTHINRLIHAPTTSAIFVDFGKSIKHMVAGCKQQPILYPDKIVFTPVAGPPKARPNLIITCR